MLTRTTLAPLSLAGCIIIWIGISLFSDREPVSFHNIGIDDTPPGGIATLTYVGVERESYTTTVHGVLIDSKGVNHEYADLTVARPAPANMPGPITFQREIVVPTRASIGPAIYAVHVERYTNFWQEFLWPVTSDYTVKMNIVAPPSSPN